MTTLFAALALTLAASQVPSEPARPKPDATSHLTWLDGALRRLATTNVGVTRADLPTVATIPDATPHLSWLARAIRQMEVIKPGMTRADLLTVFTTEGGVSNRARQAFVSRQCRYCKVDVSFELVGQPNIQPSYCIPMNSGGPLCDPTVPIFMASDQDRIVTVSRPYLQLTIMD